MPFITLDDFNYSAHQQWTGTDGLVRAKGLTPATRRPMYRSAVVEDFSLPLIPEADIPGLIAEKKRLQNSLIDLREVMGPNGGRIPSRDQNGKGYCWAHSTVSAMLLARAAANQPYVDLSAYAIACVIKGFRDQGGNGDESLDFAATRGCPTSVAWPQQSMSRSNDNPKTWENAKQHRVQKWMALETRNKRLQKQQMATCYLSNFSSVNDYDRWSHSVCGCFLESYDPFVHWIWNSWGDDWSEHGMGALKGDGWLPDSCWVLISETASAA